MTYEEMITECEVEHDLKMVHYRLEQAIKTIIESGKDPTECMDFFLLKIGKTLDALSECAR